MGGTMGIIREICKDSGIALHSVTDAPTPVTGDCDGLKSGFCTNIGGKSRIFLPEHTGHYGQVAVAAHELAHILLGHIDTNCPAYKLPIEAQESEANSFAGAFLALYLMKEYSKSGREEERQMDRLALNVEELAVTLGVSLTKAYELVRTADFPAIKCGGRWIIPVDSLKQWLTDSAKEKTPCTYPTKSTVQRA